MVLVNEFGPVQLTVADFDTVAVSSSVLPVHNGPLLVVIGVAGVSFIVTLVELVADVQPFSIAVTKYVPDCVGILLMITGF